MADYNVSCSAGAGFAGSASEACEFSLAASTAAQLGCADSEVTDFVESLSGNLSLSGSLAEVFEFIPYHEHTHADALGLFLTGAAGDGGEQDDPDASLGGYRSSARVESVGFFVTGPLQGIKVERIAAANGEGLGCLESVDGDCLRWTAPDGSPGDAIGIVPNSTRLLEPGAGDRNKFIVVSRHTAEELAGSATVTLVPIYNNVVGSSNVSGTEQQAGEVKLRCIALKVMHTVKGIYNLRAWIKTLGTQAVSDAGQLPASGSGAIETSGSFSDWPASGFSRITTAGSSLREIVYYSSRTDTVLTVPAAGRGLLGTSPAAGASDDKLDSVPGIRLAKEPPTAGAFTVAANENDTGAVSGLSWNTAITEADGLDIGKLDAGEMMGLWIWLVVPAGQAAGPAFENLIAFRFDAE